MALPVPDYGDASETGEHMDEDDRVTTSALIWLALVALVAVLAMIVRAVV